MSPCLYLLTFSRPLPLSFQGICSKMCFLCLPYPPCPGRNTSPRSRGCVILRLCLILPALSRVLGHIRSGQRWPCSAFRRAEEYRGRSCRGWDRCTLDALQGRGGPDSRDPLRHSAPLLVTGGAAHPAHSVLQWMLGSLGLEEQIWRPCPV